MKKRNAEVLFCFEPYDELVLLQLRQFDKMQLTSVEKEMRQDLSPEEEKSDDDGNFIPLVDEVRLVDFVVVIVSCITNGIPHSFRYHWIGRSSHK